MKTKKFLMLLAAVLLSCSSAFAQSSNNEPLKGDVNGDGTVDVADLTAIIKIMKDAGGAVGEKMYYWYAGTKQVEASNFTDIANRIPESEIPQTGSVSATGQYIYLVMPETYHVESLVGANGSSIEYECNDAFGYHIYKTVNTINGTVSYAIQPTIYYWYIGTKQPTSVDSTWRTSNKDAGFTEIVQIGDGVTWFAYPDTWTYTAIDSYGDGFVFNAWVKPEIKNSIPGYVILRMTLGAEDEIKITFSK